MDYDLRKFPSDTHLLAVFVPAGRVGRRDLVPPQAVAVAISGDRAGPLCGPEQKIALLGDDAESGGRSDGVLVVRMHDWSTPLPDIDVATQDRCQAVVSLTLALRPLRQPVELVSLHQTLMGGRSWLTGDDVANYLLAAVTAAVREVAAETPVETLVERVSTSQLEGRLRQKLAGPLFAAGLELAGLAQARFSSEDYLQQRRAQRQAALAGQWSRLQDQVSQMRHQMRSAELDRLAEVIQKLDQLGAKLEPADDPAARARQLGRLLRQIAPADRELFAARSLELGQQAATMPGCPPVLVAAGRQLYLLGEHDQQIAPLPATRDLADWIGPLRWVRQQGERLLVGGRDGVADLRLRPGPSAEVAETYGLPDEGPRRRAGVNSVALAGEYLLISHSEAGLVRWRMDGPYPPETLLTPVEAGLSLRAVQTLDDGLAVCAADDTLLAFDPRADTFSPRILFRTGSPITAIAADGSDLWVGDQSGGLWEFLEGRHRRLADCSGAIGSIQPVVLGMLRRLVVAAGRSGVTLVQPELGVAARLGDQQGARQAVHRNGWTVAVNARRDRLHFWSAVSGDPLGAPVRTTPVHQLAGHSVQWIELLELA